MKLNENALPYDITKRIRQHLASCDDSNDGKDSFYIQNKREKIEIRVSNHCTHLWTWHQRKSGKSDGVLRISIVFESEDTYNNENLILKNTRTTPLRVLEYVYRCNNPQYLTNKDVSAIIKSINSSLKTGQQYTDITGKLMYIKERVSINPVVDETSYDALPLLNTHEPLRNHVIRLSERDLYNIIEETVRDALIHHN